MFVNSDRDNRKQFEILKKRKTNISSSECYICCVISVHTAPTFTMPKDKPFYSGCQETGSLGNVIFGSGNLPKTQTSVKQLSNLKKDIKDLQKI